MDVIILSVVPIRPVARLSKLNFLLACLRARLTTAKTNTHDTKEKFNHFENARRTKASAQLGRSPGQVSVGVPSVRPSVPSVDRPRSLPRTVTQPHGALAAANVQWNGSSIPTERKGGLRACLRLTHHRTSTFSLVSSAFTSVKLGPLDRAECSNPVSLSPAVMVVVITVIVFAHIIVAPFSFRC
ncbi:uncharacterized protein J3D65DRAFT_600071 [Phyllosticta citribraziliensis]|uniref:Uncharacterized protein n=1 Tax=Phyllosticta citribraziliensis TaxID=989973 RepID=A0ABR1M3Y7_9PEZI